MKIALAGYNGFLGKNIMNDLPGHDYILLNRELLYGKPDELGRAMEARLTEEGFRFLYPGIDQAINNLVQEI